VLLDRLIFIPTKKAMTTLTILNRSYLTVVQKFCCSLPKSAQYCAAKLIHYFSNWTRWKKAVQRTQWIYQKLKGIYEDLMGEHSLHSIRAALAALIDAGLLERRNNPGNGQDKTYQYKVNTELLSRLLDKTAGSVVETPDVKSEPSEITVENHTENLTIESNQKTVPKPEVGKKNDLKEEVSTEEIPEDLKGKLEELEIPLDKKVRNAIASHHISQAYGAVAHIENTFETINNPRGVFLYQIGKQPVEPLGARSKVVTALDCADGMTLERLKFWYPNSWKEAASYWGITIEDD
jgi:hypothetical protein